MVVLCRPRKDDNFHFSALVFALFAKIEVYHSLATVRSDTTEYLGVNDVSRDAIWSQYLVEMAEYDTYEDKVTLRTMCNIFNILVSVVFTLGNDVFVHLIPGNNKPVA